MLNTAFITDNLIFPLNSCRCYFNDNSILFELYLLCNLFSYWGSLILFRQRIEWVVISWLRWGWIFLFGLSICHNSCDWFLSLPRSKQLKRITTPLGNQSRYRPPKLRIFLLFNLKNNILISSLSFCPTY